MNVKRRHPIQAFTDFVTLPLRVLALIETDRCGLSSLASDRYYYSAREVIGYCLDIGCGKHNRFVDEFLRGHGRGLDVHPYEGLTRDHLVDDLTRFPFPDGTFESVTFIATLNHIPRSQRDGELAEAFRCLTPGGNVVVTMGPPLVEILGHKRIEWYDRWFGTHYDMDSERGMHEEEAYYLLDSEIRERLARAGFRGIVKKRFVTQWGLNHLFVGWKPATG